MDFSRGGAEATVTIDEITAEVLVAANDHAADKRIAFGMVLDLPASVIVHATSPRGSGYFEFAAPGLTKLAPPIALQIQPHLFG